MKKLFLGLGALVLGAFTLVSCGGNSNQITLWCGAESADFYEKEGNEFFKNNAEFSQFSLKAVATDAGTTPGEMITDNTKCADIITVAHDNIGKLANQNKIKPLINEDLINQIKNDNPENFVSVAQSTLGGDSEKRFFAVPYISQSLFLYYNKSLVTEEQAKTFEGLKEAGKAANAKGFTVTGLDGYNFSFTILALNAETKTSTLRLYNDGTRLDAYAQGDDEVALLRWSQRIFNDPNGGLLPSDTAWAVSVQNKKVLAVVGGAWHYNAFLKSVGEENFGATVLPTMTLTEDDVAGTTIAAGTKFQAGTFADCKVFLINAASDASKYNAISALLKHLSSTTVQNKSFKECQNLPAYKGSSAYIESIKSEISANSYATATAQLKMAEFGMPQPFINGTLNTLYYSSGAPKLYELCIVNEKGAYNDIRKLRETLYRMEFIWKYMEDPADNIPETLPTPAVKAFQLMFQK